MSSRPHQVHRHPLTTEAVRDRSPPHPAATGPARHPYRRLVRRRPRIRGHHGRRGLRRARRRTAPARPAWSPRPRPSPGAACRRWPRSSSAATTPPRCPLPKRAEQLAAGRRAAARARPTPCDAELAAADAEIRPGGPPSALRATTPRGEDELIAAFAADITDFTVRQRPRPRGRRQRRLHRARARRRGRRAAAQLPLRGGGPARGLRLRQLHPVHRAAPPRASAGPPRAAGLPTRAGTARPARRCCGPCSPRCSRSAP